MRSLRALFLLPLAAGLLGCETPQQHAEHIELKDRGVSVVAYPTQIRGAYVFNPGSDNRFCAEPPPDVALDSLQDIAGKLNLKAPEVGEAGGELSAKITADVVQLAGRSQLLSLAREMLYRACELSNNSKADTAESIALYQAVVALVRDLGQAEKDLAAAERLRAVAAIEGRSSKIDAIISKVAGPAGAVRAADLSALIDSTGNPTVTGLKNALAAQTTAAGLRSVLLSLGDNVVDPLFDAATR